MTEPYYDDGTVRLFLGDCREVTAWLDADVLCTDPPYGIGWRRGENKNRSSKNHPGIKGDTDTSARDDALRLWGDRPGIVFGSYYAPQPPGLLQVLGFHKPPDAGVVGSTTGFRRDLEPIYLVGPWPKRSAARSSVVGSNARLQGSPAGVSARAGHPHAKPVDVLESLISSAPPRDGGGPVRGLGQHARRGQESGPAGGRRGDRREVRRGCGAPVVAVRVGDHAGTRVGVRAVTAARRTVPVTRAHTRAGGGRSGCPARGVAL